MADEISIGPWTVTAERDDEGRLLLEVRLDGETRAAFVLPPEDAADTRDVPRPGDMDF